MSHTLRRVGTVGIWKSSDGNCAWAEARMRSHPHSLRGHCSCGFPIFFLFSIFHKFSIGMCHVCVYVVVVNWYSVVRHWQRSCCRWLAWTNLLKCKENLAFSPVAANFKHSLNYLDFELGMRNQEISMCLALASDTVTYVELNLCYGIGCVQKVCRCLVNGGPLSIGDIGRLAEVNPLEVENSIVVLLQHNCVQGFKAQQQEDGNAGKNPSQYSLLF